MTSRARLLQSAALALAFAGCASTPTSHVDAAGSAAWQSSLVALHPSVNSDHLFVSNDETMPNVVRFDIPVSDASAPTMTIPYTAGFTDPRNMRFDAAGRLYVPNWSENILIFAPPFRPSSQPIVTIPFTGGVQDLAFDGSGRMFATQSQGGVDVYRPPFTMNSVKQFAIKTGLYNTTGITFDSAGRLFVLDNGQVDEFDPPFSRSSAPVAVFGQLNDYSGIACDVTGRIFASNYNDVPVFKPPFSGSSKPVFSIPIPNGVPRYLTFGPRKELYVTVYPSLVLAFKPPFSSASKPYATITNGDFGAMGVAVNP